MMTFVFLIAILLIIIAIIGIVASTIEYFMSNTITRITVIEYRQTLLLATVVLIIGIIFMAICINAEGIPQLISW